METNHIAYTIRLYLAWRKSCWRQSVFLRAGYFKDVDLVLGSHVGNKFATVTDWARPRAGWFLCCIHSMAAAHSAGAPWEGKRARCCGVDGHGLEHGGNTRTQRAHYVIVNGGDQPTWCRRRPRSGITFASWIFRILRRCDLGNTMAQAAAAMTGTTVDHGLGSAWPTHFNKVIAEVRRTSRPSECRSGATMIKPSQGAAEGNRRQGGGLEHKVKPLELPMGRAAEGRTIWRYLLECANCVHELSRQYSNLPGHSWPNAVARLR